MKYDIDLIKAIWNQKRAGTSILILATICVLLGRWHRPEKTYYMESDGWYHLAYADLGKYDTDYGVGYAFSVLCYKNFQVAEYCDGSL
jgi:hypothetical protein